MGYGYDNTTGGSSGIGRLYVTNTSNVGTGYYWDSMGRLNHTTIQLPSTGAYQMGFIAAYDLAGHLTSLTYPDGRVVKKNWDGAGHLQSVNYDNWNGQSVNYPYLSSASYYPDGSPASMA